MKPIYRTAAVIAIASAIILLNSCKIGHKYVRPELNLPETIVNDHTDSTTIADIEWWTMYTDTTLRKLISQALEYNKDMEIAVARVNELAYQKRISTSKLFPQFSGKSYNEREIENYNGKSKHVDDYELSLKGMVAWEIDLWGNLRWGREKSIAEFLASVENQRAVRITIIAEVAQAYLELIALDNELDIVKQTLEARTEGVRLAKIRYLGGLTSEIVFQQARLELSKTRTLVPDLERKIALKENEISFLTGSYPGKIERAAKPESITLPETLPVGLPSTLLERRPDIRKAEQGLIAANAEVGVALTNMFPRITLTAVYGSETSTLKTLLNSPYQMFTATLLSPIFGAGQNIANHKAKKAALKGAVAEYEKAVLNAFKDTHNAIVNFNKIKEIYDLREKYQAAAKSTMELAQLQYINGVIGYLDLLDAQRGYFDAQISLSNAMRDKQIMMVNLYKALGGGW